MKYILYTIISIWVLAGCKSSKNYLSRTDNDKTVFEAIKIIKKHNSDTGALHALPIFSGS
jgi:hypothetical protein